MGSKRSMLINGLGHLLLQQVKTASRFVDLFTGAGYVAWFVAENTETPVLAVDLQVYASVLANAIVGRVESINPKTLQLEWIEKTIEVRDNNSLWIKANQLKNHFLNIETWVTKSRRLCEYPSDLGPVWNAYGGHYFSADQAITFDLLISKLPKKEPNRTVCLAACISAAIECVAAPGHTAQPFQPTSTAAPYIFEAWNRDPIYFCQRALNNICPRHAQKLGKVITSNGLNVAKTLNSKDLVFIDPPYSSVQYSRFYHVLETIARGKHQIDVSGIGRYPPIIDRPQSKFSNVGQSKEATRELLETLAISGCKIIFTFPSGNASNGLSGEYIKKTSLNWFQVEDYTTIEGRFSTLGGNNSKRNAREKSSELILLMSPK